MAQSDAVRSVILQGEGTKPIVLMLARTNLALPGTLVESLQGIFSDWAVLLCCLLTEGGTLSVVEP